MKKRVVVGIISGIIILLGVAGSGSNSPSASPTNNTQPIQASSEIKQESSASISPVCDGTAITSNCVVDSTHYSKYIYHPSEPEKSHNESVTTYREEVTGYCTLCNDGTYSPSCATGSGACSHHGGVAQWNAPRYTNTPQYSTKKIVDAPAKESYYEKITQ